MFKLNGHGSAAPICVGPRGKLIKESSLLVLHAIMMKLLYVPFGTPTPQNKSNHGSTKLANPVVGAQTRLDFLFFLSNLHECWILLSLEPTELARCQQRLFLHAGSVDHRLLLTAPGEGPPNLPPQWRRGGASDTAWYI